MTYNRSEIMKAAWALYRKMEISTRRWPEAARKEKLATYFSDALKLAWAQAKSANVTKADLENQQFLIHMKDHWDSSDFELDRELEQKIREKAA